MLTKSKYIQKLFFFFYILNAQLEYVDIDTSRAKHVHIMFYNFKLFSLEFRFLHKTSIRVQIEIQNDEGPREALKKSF